MTLEIPVFDLAGLEQWADLHDNLPSDPTELRSKLRQAVEDLVAAAEHIELLEAALMERRLA